MRKNLSPKSISWKRSVFYFKMLIDIMTPQIILSKNMIWMASLKVVSVLFTHVGKFASVLTLVNHIEVMKNS